MHNKYSRNAREGLTLHNVYYNDSGAIRPLMYRASVAELFVPYGDPRPPFHRKMVCIETKRLSDFWSFRMTFSFKIL